VDSPPKLNSPTPSYTPGGWASPLSVGDVSPDVTGATEQSMEKSFSNSTSAANPTTDIPYLVQRVVIETPKPSYHSARCTALVLFVLGTVLSIIFLVSLVGWPFYFIPGTLFVLGCKYNYSEDAGVRFFGFLNCVGGWIFCGVPTVITVFIVIPCIILMFFLLLLLIYLITGV
jgi:hypothetical protein